MKIERLPSGSYRVRKTVNYKVYSIVFDHKPTQNEIVQAVSKSLQDDIGGTVGSFGQLATEYINNRRNVISPLSVRTYLIKLNQLSEGFKKKNLNDITTADVQAEINEFAKTHAPKTVKTLHGFIASVMGEYRPELCLRTKLPQAIKKDVYEPNEEDIKRILEEVKGTHFSVAFQLGVFSCRRGEICAATIDDLDGNNLHIHRNMVEDENNKWVIKETPKTDTSDRILPLPETLADEIREQGFIFDGHPNALNKAIHRVQKRLGIPAFKFHALRSYFASYAHSLGIPDADILAIGGWKTENVMKSVYRKSIEESKNQAIQKLHNGLWG